MHDIRQGTCPLCGHNEVIEAKPYSFTERAGSGDVYMARAPDTSAFIPGTKDLHLGHLWSFTCRRCDYTQLFAQGAATVPIGPEHGTRLITGALAQPSR